MGLQARWLVYREEAQFESVGSPIPVIPPQDIIQEATNWRKNSMASDTGSIVTVDGRIAPSELGKTITHEHLFIDVAEAWFDQPEKPHERRLSRQSISLDNLWYVRRHNLQHKPNMRLDSMDEAIEEVERYYHAGGDTLVDVTPKNTGHDPQRIRGISRATGLQIIHGTSYYTEPAHPSSLADRSLDSIADEFVSDVREGIDDTDVRAGLIGEIGVSGEIQPAEEKVLRAGAQAALRTGASISIHPPLFEGTHPPSWWGHKILDILEEEGLPAERAVLCHQDQINELEHPELTHQLKLAERGAFVEFDLWGWEMYIDSQDHAAPSDNWRASATMEFIKEDLHDHLLFSHDVNHKWQRTKYGGFGYGHILENIVPMLKAHGVEQEDLDQMLIENPKRMLTFEEPEE